MYLKPSVDEFGIDEEVRAFTARRRIYISLQSRIRNFSVEILDFVQVFLRIFPVKTVIADQTRPFIIVVTAANLGTVSSFLND